MRTDTAELSTKGALAAAGVPERSRVEWPAVTVSAAGAASEVGADPDWEYAPLRIPADVTRISAAAQLSLRAEFEDWELASVRRYTDGTRRVWLRRRRSRQPGVLPLPGPIR